MKDYFIKKEDLGQIDASFFETKTIHEAYAIIRDGSFKIWIAKDENINFEDPNSNYFYGSSYNNFNEICDQFDVDKNTFISFFFPEWFEGNFIDPDYLTEWDGFLLDA